MKYMMRGRMLSTYGDNKALAQIKSSFLDAKKTILLIENHSQYQTDIDVSNAPPERQGDVRFRSYTLTDEDGNIILEAHPGYASEDDPDVVGWSLCRAQRVDHADVQIKGADCLLIMHNSQNCSLQDSDGLPLLQIMHNGISGGWTISAREQFQVQEVCGLFIFFRYIEQENELVVV